MPLVKDFPPDLYHLRPGEKPLYGDFPDLKTGVEWFKSLMSEEEWKARRDAQGKRFYQALTGELQDPSGVGRFFENNDRMGWYLFLGESFTDHPWNYEVNFGCRVLPVFAAIGRNLDLLKKIDGFRERCIKVLKSEKAQPNGILFELVVAARYARAGGTVSFRNEKAGLAKSYDLDVDLDGKRWTVECKRIELGEYADKERTRMRELWVPASMQLAMADRNALANITLDIELQDVPDDYLISKAQRFLSAKKASITWSDEIGSGIISDLDLRPIQEAMENSHWLFPGPQYMKLLTGKYIRYDNSLVIQKVKYASNPHYIDDIGLAVVARWECTSERSIEKRARDILNKLAEANEQLPHDVAGVVHIGFEALGTDVVEQRRYEKILSTVQQFDREKSALEYVYCHYFAPEASPEDTWAIDETVQWIGISPTKRPLDKGHVLLPEHAISSRSGVHWIPEPAQQ
ncbi:MAG: transposase [Xanthobacteraceae bacterium]|nr:transposase [Xanthobacteraceae bacterium]QYK46342.1 MAG: transposase [Xanthobacteraceae bacterium]